MIISPVSVRDKLDVVAVDKKECRDESSNGGSGSDNMSLLGRAISFRKRISVVEMTDEMLAELDDVDTEPPSLDRKRSDSSEEVADKVDTEEERFLLPKRSSSFGSAASLASKCRDWESLSPSDDERRSSRELDISASSGTRSRSRTRRRSRSRRGKKEKESADPDNETDSKSQNRRARSQSASRRRRSKSQGRRPRSLSQTRVAATVGVTFLTVGDTAAFTTEPTRGAFSRSNSDTSILSRARESISSTTTSTSAFGLPQPGFVQSSTSLNSFKTLGAISHMAATINSSSGSFKDPKEMLGNLDAREVLADLETRQILGDVDASILGDLSCVAEEMPAVLKQGDLAIKVGSLASQVLALTADLLPGHDVSMDNLAYQILMVASASHAVFQTVHPMIQAALRESNQDSVTIHDQRTFEDLFSPAGVTMSQFHALSGSAMEWIDVKPGEVVPSDKKEDDQHFYYLYSGEVEVEKDGELHYRVERGEAQKSDKAAASGLIGEETLIQSLSNGVTQEQSMDKITIRAGDSGAKMLRMKKSKLDRIMNQDKDLSRSMGILVMQSMQAKMKLKRKPLSPNPVGATVE